MGTHPIFESDFDCLTDVKQCSVCARVLAPSSGFVSTRTVRCAFRRRWARKCLCATSPTSTMVIEVGDRFTVRSDKTTVGTGVVTKIYDDLTEKQVSEWFDMKRELKKEL